MKKDGATRIEDVAQYIIELFEEFGVKYWFLNLGSDWVPLINAFAKYEVQGRTNTKAITVPHEIVTIAMAAGYSIVSGEPSVAAIHTNVGTVNSIGNIMNAFSERSPLIVLAGKAPITEEDAPGGRDSFINWMQDMHDQGGLVRQYVKWDYEVQTNLNLHTVIGRAIKIANSPPKGPVYLMFPREVLVGKMDGVSRLSVPKFRCSTPTAPDPDAIRKVAEVLVESEMPLIITSSLGGNPKSVNHLIRLCNRLAVPVVEHVGNRMNFPTTNKLHLGYDPSPYVEKADVILVIDNIVPWIPKRVKISDSTFIIHINNDPTFRRIPLWGFHADLPIAADSNLALSALVNSVEKIMDTRPNVEQKIETRRKEIEQIHDKKKQQDLETALQSRRLNVISKQWLSYVINKVKSDDSVILDSYVLRRNQVEFEQTGTFIGQPLMGYLGWSYGAALGVKLAMPDMNVINCLGDGAYLYCVPDVCNWVSKAYDIPVLTVIFNNKGHQALRRMHTQLYPDGWSTKSNRYHGVDFDFSTKFSETAKVYGLYSESVEKPDDVENALRRGLEYTKKKKVGAVIDVVCGMT